MADTSWMSHDRQANCPYDEPRAMISLAPDRQPASRKTTEGSSIASDAFALLMEPPASAPFMNERVRPS